MFLMTWDKYRGIWHCHSRTVCNYQMLILLLHCTLKSAPECMRISLNWHTHTHINPCQFAYTQVTLERSYRLGHQKEHTTIYSCHVYIAPNSVRFYFVNYASTLSMKRENRYGDNTPRCRTPHNKLKNAENLSHHLTLTAKHRSKMDCILVVCGVSDAVIVCFESTQKQ